MTINSKVDICNMAVSHLGNYGSVENIDDPNSDIELTFSLWYDISRQSFLKMTIPNFSMARRRVARLDEDPPHPFTYVYEYPSDCLKVLGIGAVELKENNYTVENNRIYTNVLYEDGAPIRFIKDVEDVSAMSPEFKIGLSWYLASNTALEITQDIRKKNSIEASLPAQMANLSGLNAQENRPIRVARSKFRDARYSGFPRESNKR